MNRFEDEEEEEDELQMILEGRDVYQFREYKDNRKVSIEDDSDVDIDQEYEDQRTKSKDNKKRKLKTNENRRKNEMERNVTPIDPIDTIEDVSETINNYETNVEEDNKVKVKVRRIVSRPRVVLNADKLISNEGIAVLPQIFNDFKFGQKGSELKDLNAIMFRYNHWSHRLFPTLTFDDFIEKCEQLGNKRALKTFVAKIRYDLPLNLKPNQDEQVVQDLEDINNDNDFDTIFAKSFANVIQSNDSESQDLSTGVESPLKEGLHSQPIDSEPQDLNTGVESPPKEGSYSQPIDTNTEEDEELIDGQNITNTDNTSQDKQINDFSDEELTEEQILMEINSDI